MSAWASLSPCPQIPPLTWLSRMVVASKKDGSLRRTMDLQNVNVDTKREMHHMPIPSNLVARISLRTVKIMLDAWNGYHSLSLDDSARQTTSFIMEWGCYRYLRAPQEFHASRDSYTRRASDITKDIRNMKKCIDDTCMYSENFEDGFWEAVNYIDLYSRNGMVFNPDKFMFGKKTVEFAGFEVTKDGYKPTKKILNITFFLYKI